MTYRVEVRAVIDLNEDTIFIDVENEFQKFVKQYRQHLVVSSVTITKQP